MPLLLITSLPIYAQQLPTMKELHKFLIFADIGLSHSPCTFGSSII